MAEKEEVVYTSFIARAGSPARLRAYLIPVLDREIAQREKKEIVVPVSGFAKDNSGSVSNYTKK